MKSCFLKIYKIEKPMPRPKKKKAQKQNLYTNIYRSFIHNCQNLKAMKMSFGSWEDNYGLSDNGVLLNAKKPWKDMEEA